MKHYVGVKLDVEIDADTARFYRGVAQLLEMDVGDVLALSMDFVFVVGDGFCEMTVPEAACALWLWEMVR